MEPNSSPKKSLAIFAVLFESGWYVWHFRKELALAICLPAVASIVITLFFSTRQNGQLSGWIISLLTGFAWCLAAISCHRLVLLGPGSVSAFGVVGHYSREWKFIGRVIYIAVIISLLAAFIAALESLIGISSQSGERHGLSIIQMVALMLEPLTIVVAIASLAPLSLTLPATSVDHELGLSGAFGLAKGNRVRLAIVLCGFPLLLEFTLQSIARLSPVAIQALLTQIAYWVMLPFEIALLSICYKKLIEMRDAQSERVNA